MDVLERQNGVPRIFKDDLLRFFRNRVIALTENSGDSPPMVTSPAPGNGIEVSGADIMINGSASSDLRIHNGSPLSKEVNARIDNQDLRLSFDKDNTNHGQDDSGVPRPVLLLPGQTCHLKLVPGINSMSEESSCALRIVCFGEPVTVIKVEISNETGDSGGASDSAPPPPDQSSGDDTIWKSEEERLADRRRQPYISFAFSIT